MKPLRDALDKVHPLFNKGGPLAFGYPVYEALDTFLYTPGEVAHGSTHVRDAIDLKRMMITVVLALLPVTLFGMWNVGYLANSAIASAGGLDVLDQQSWHYGVHTWLGFQNDPGSLADNFILGALFFLPVYIVCMFVGGHIELIFSVLRGHEINEGFLVTGLLFPLTLPASIPLWQVAVGIAFGVIVAKEVFGGTGRNFLNVALTSRAFLYFAYPTEISGDKVWTAVDGYSGATALGKMALTPAKGSGTDYDNNPVAFLGDSTSSVTVGDQTASWESDVTWMDGFLGNVQGCFGETSALLCLVGAVVLIGAGVGSWKIMAGVIAGTVGTSLLLNGVNVGTNPMLAVPPHYHLVFGGLAFGLVFMATDPVSASMTEKGKWIYGILIGFMTVLIRCVNPAYPEGIMLAILFGNVFAPLIDWGVVQMNVKRRLARYATV
ncbi:MAG: NADH:ubiquinone reductase (Na(+)-transporting) subunit B [Planctomycetota bacterium]